MAVDVKELTRRYEALKDERSPWDTAWKDLAAHFLPTKWQDDKGASRKRPMLNSKLVDSTGILAMRTLAAGMQGGMTSPARPWFRLTLEDDDLAKSHDARAWLDEVEQRMRTVFHRSNFYNAIHTVYSDLGTFGTAFMFELADLHTGFRFIPLVAGTYVLDTNATGRVDTIIRCIPMTARQIVQEFGRERIPRMVRDAADKVGELTHKFEVMHAVFPRSDRNLLKVDAQNMPFASVYWMQAAQDGGKGFTTLRESGFEEFPGFGPRWDVNGMDVYGRSPAMDVLPDCRMLQQMTATTLKATHKAVDPPMSVAASLQAVGLDLMPGGVNYVDTQPGQAPQAATPLLQIRPDLNAAYSAIENTRQQIQMGLYNDLFRLLLGSDRRQITAREVAAKEEEKLILIGPVLERLHDEQFIPLIDRTFNLMSRLDYLPVPPDELQGVPLKVEFISLLAQAQQIVSTSSVDQFVAFVGNAAQAWPGMLDAVNYDEMMDKYAAYLGVAVGVLNDQEKRDQMRQARAEAQAQAQQSAMAQQQAETVGRVAKDLSSAQVDADGMNALEAAIGGMGAL